MRVIILLNGEPYRGKIDAQGAHVLCCDGAYNWAKGRVRIDENLGDFDSAVGKVEPPPRKIYPSEKDMTDGEIAIDRAIKLGADSISIFGGGGKREDHFLGNLHLLYRALRAGIAVKLYTNGAMLTLCGEGEQKFFCPAGKTVSLLPFGGDVHIMDMWGLKYAERDLTLFYGSTRGISNLTENQGGFSFRVISGTALLIINEGEI